MTGRCAKLTVVAIIEKDGKFFVGSNYCYNPQKKCPRRSLTTGSGYLLCRKICMQRHHAEVDCCRKAGRKNTEGNTMYLIGHHYCCDKCKEVIKRYGIKKVIINKLPPTWNLNPSMDLIKGRKK